VVPVVVPSHHNNNNPLDYHTPRKSPTFACLHVSSIAATSPGAVGTVDVHELVQDNLFYHMQHSQMKEKLQAVVDENEALVRDNSALRRELSEICTILKHQPGRTR